MRINFKRKYYTSRNPTQEMQDVYKYICDNPGATVLVEGQFAYIEDKPILDGVLEK